MWYWDVRCTYNVCHVTPNELIHITPGCIGDRPIIYKTVRYNCRIFIYDRKILLIRPKLYLANDGVYRENRWFAPWMKRREIETYRLPAMITNITQQVWSIRNCPMSLVFINKCVEGNGSHRRGGHRNEGYVFGFGNMRRALLPRQVGWLNR